jgi:competence protein ComEA
MGEITKSQLAVYVAAAIAIALIGARYLRDSRPAGAGAGATAKAVPVRVSGGDGGDAGGPVVVQVAGEVRRPGVYRLSAGQRVQDAVRMAGGLTARADLAGVNLAAKAEDGRQVNVPAHGAATAAVPAGGAGAGAAPGAAPSAPINLNTATAEQLDQLDGVGPATAQKILAYRQEHGGFRSVSELDRVPGIGPARMAALKDRVTV